MNRVKGWEMEKVIVEEIWSSIIVLQSLFQPGGKNPSVYLDQQYVDDSYSSISTFIIFNKVLRRLFSRFREYQRFNEQINFSTASPEKYKLDRLYQYFEALQQFWAANRQRLSPSNYPNQELLKETKETLAQIIQQNSNTLVSKQDKNGISKLDTTPTKYQPQQTYKQSSPVQGQNRLNVNVHEIQIGDTRQKTEPNLQQNVLRSEIREKELQLQKSQLTIQVLKEDNSNLQKLSQMAKIELQSLQEENNKKAIRIGMLEMQIDVLKRKQVKELDKDFRSSSYNSSFVSPITNGSSPYRNQPTNYEEELNQLRQEKAKMLIEITNLKKMIIDYQSRYNSTQGSSKQDSELKQQLDQQQSEIQELRQQLQTERKKNRVSGDKQSHQQIQTLQVEVDSMKNQQAFMEEQIYSLQTENQSLKDFVQDQLKKNKTLMMNINELQNDKDYIIEKFQSSNRQLKEPPQKKDQENIRLKQENQQILDENQRLSEKIKELYLDLNQRTNQQENQTKIKNLQLSIQGLQEQLNKGNDDRKRLNSQNEMLKKQIMDRDLIIQQMQDQKRQNQIDKLEEVPLQILQQIPQFNFTPQRDIEIEEYGEDQKISEIKVQNEKNIRFLPDLEVGSHFNCVIHVLEILNSFASFISLTYKEEDQCQMLQRLFLYIRGQQEVELEELKFISQRLSESFAIEIQADNRANDLMFQIIDQLSRCIVSDESDETVGQIAKFIQAKDSPIYEIFFFLQRSLPLHEEIQNDEVPLINSIKHVRYLETIRDCQDLSQYLNQMINIEGEENGGPNFSFVVLPQVLILNVSELSQAKSKIVINQELQSTILTSDTYVGKPFLYHLVGIIHCQQGIQENENEPIYYLTINSKLGWLQVLYDQFEQINNVEEVLTFRKNHGDKELLIYERQYENE